MEGNGAEFANKNHVYANVSVGAAASFVSVPQPWKTKCALTVRQNKPWKFGFEKPHICNKEDLVPHCSHPFLRRRRNGKPSFAQKVRPKSPLPARFPSTSAWFPSPGYRRSAELQEGAVSGDLSSVPEHRERGQEQRLQSQRSGGTALHGQPEVQRSVTQQSPSHS